MTGKPILDVCCGGRQFYTNKEDARVHFNDFNPRGQQLCDGRHFLCSPETDYDFTDMPFDDESFHHVVFDPPHFKSAGEDSYMVIKYGKLSDNWKEVLKAGFSECFRVLKVNGTLVFKWCEYQIPLKEILSLTDQMPVYGNQRPKQSKTHWLVFFKGEK